MSSSTRLRPKFKQVSTMNTSKTEYTSCRQNRNADGTAEDCEAEVEINDSYSCNQKSQEELCN